MGKILRSVYSFYLSHFLTGFVLSLCSAGLFKTYGLPILTTIFWFKLITMAIVFYAVNGYKKKEYYYYRNLNVSARLLWGITLSLDIFFFTAILMVTHYRR